MKMNILEIRQIRQNGRQVRTCKLSHRKYDSQIRHELLARAGKVDGGKVNAPKESKGSEVKKSKMDSGEVKGMWGAA